ncbi:MAG TPA: transporter [Burkholderiales bacterium]|nr:transporter [Burkholderiales bacterium]
MLAVAAALPGIPGFAQVRGVYPLGMSATTSGVMAQPGISYINAFLFYSRDELVGPGGEVVATGENSVLMDMNTLVWVSTQRLKPLGDARVSVAATLPIANNSLSSDAQGAMSGGGGFADSYYQVLILGWQMQRADIKAIYGFLAPTGRFQAGASDNVGSGYWTHTLSAGETFWVTNGRATAISGFEIYELHTTQEGTGIHPGQTLSVDYSVTHTVPAGRDLSLQLGLIGYSQWQTTAKSGPTITPAQAAERYRVSALGLGISVLSPARSVSVGARYYSEFAATSTLRGYSVQIVAAIGF